MTDQRAAHAGVVDGEFPEKEGGVYHVAPERKEQSSGQNCSEKPVEPNVSEILADQAAHTD
jgi:hypothetical protein